MVWQCFIEDHEDLFQGNFANDNTYVGGICDSSQRKLTAPNLTATCSSLVCFNLQKSPSWKPKSPPKSRKSQNRPHSSWNRPMGGDFAHVEDHWAREWLGKKQHSHPNNKQKPEIANKNTGKITCQYGQPVWVWKVLWSFCLDFHLHFQVPWLTPLFQRCYLKALLEKNVSVAAF